MARDRLNTITARFARLRVRPVPPGRENVPPAQPPGYTAAEAAHQIEEFLELRLGRDEFWTWLMRYPPHRAGCPGDPVVEDEVDRVVLALFGLRNGTRDWPAVAAALRDARARLTGLARG